MSTQTTQPAEAPKTPAKNPPAQNSAVLVNVPALKKVRATLKAKHAKLNAGPHTDEVSTVERVLNLIDDLIVLAEKIKEVI